MKISKIDLETQVVNIHIGGDCNLECKMCAYKYVRQFECLSLEVYENILNQIFDFLSKYRDRKLIMCYIGGEPTLDLDKLQQFIELAYKIRNEFSDRFYLAVTTNGYYGRSLDSIKKMEELDFDIIQLSLSKDHYEQGNSAWIQNIWGNQKRDNIWLSFIGGREIIKYYPYVNDYDEDAILFYPLKNNIFYKDMLVKTDDIQTYNYKVMGIYIIPKGIYPCCPGEAYEEACYLGSLDEIEESLNKVFNSSINFSIQGDISSIFPACIYLKKCFNLDIDCFSKNKVNFSL